MARQCHLDTCPTGIATQREDLRAKFTGTPEMVERYFLAIAEDFRRELAAVGARTVGELIGESRRLLTPTAAARPELAAVVGAAPWPADAARRADPSLPARTMRHAPASPLEARVASAFRDQGPVTASGLRLSTADRSFGRRSLAPWSAASCAARSGSSCAAPPDSRSGRSPGLAWS